MKKLLFLVLLLLPSITFANQATYTADVSVDVSADNAVIAKQNAMKIAHHKALVTVARRITTDDAVSIFEALKPEQTVNFIKEVDVVDEKTSDVRYMATLKVKINEDILKIYMREKNMPLIKDTPHDVLVIPIMRRAAHTEPFLFVDDNLWLQLWNSKHVTDGTISYHTIKTNRNLNVNDILALNAATFDTIIKENGIGDIHILEAFPQDDNFMVNLTAYTTGLKGSFKIDMANNPNYMSEALTESVSRISNFIKKQRITQVQQNNEIVVLYNYPSLKNWIETEKMLKTIDYISNLNVDAFGNGKVQFKIEYTGSIEGLQRYLQRNGLQINEYGNNIYLLEKTN